MQDYIIRGMTKDGFIKVMAAQTSELCEHMRNVHKTMPLATAALGRTLTAASLMGAEMKNENASLTIQIHGGGALGTITAVSDNTGNVRGYLQNPALELPLRSDGKLDVGGGVGNGGILTIMKDDGENMPFSGKTELISGEIAEDIAAYYAQSEQIPTVCALGVLVGVDQSVTAAGGFILQLMPFAPMSCIDDLEERLGRVSSVTSELVKKNNIENVINDLLFGLDFVIMEKHPIKYECKCSEEKVKVALISMGKSEIGKMLTEDKPISVTCQFCDRVYCFEKVDLEALLKNII